MSSPELKDHLALRFHVVDMLKKELVGPSSGEEIISGDGPLQRYGAGVLFPINEQPEIEESETQDEEFSDAAPEQEADPKSIGKLKFRNEDDGNGLIDGEVNLANQFMPSAMGLTAFCDLSDGLVVKCIYALYKKHSAEGDRSSQRQWKRHPISDDIGTITFNSEELLTREINHKHERKLPGPSGDGIELNVFVRAPSSRYPSHYRLVTVTLINKTIDGDRRSRDLRCIYQSEIHLSSTLPKAFKALPKREEFSELSDAEAETQALLFRKTSEYGVGHGVSVNWLPTDDDSTDAVFSETIAKFEIPPILPTRRPNGLGLSMKILSDEDGYSLDGTGYKLCSALLKDYEDWITQRIVEARDTLIEPWAKKTAERNIDACRSCLERMKRGLQLLVSDPNVAQVFAKMNQAMLAQQFRYSEVTSNGREWVADPDTKQLGLDRCFRELSEDEVTREWRPFQLAFVLMTISSIVLQDEEALAERELVDVIWFPTGGGKTEAYLGLTAFTILWRRVDHGNWGTGTAVLMRYTLRLLTAQQFERASTLICALELIRREDRTGRFGEQPISIGLWVGSALSPNSDSDAVNAHKKLQRDTRASNPFVINSCPWCGSKMGVVQERPQRVIKGLVHKAKPSRIELRCDAPDCSFSNEDGLPIHVVDDRIYASRPSLVIATVDKFAMLPWREQNLVGRIFGLDEDGPMPPSLIIQDELHLISGPLGSMTGHYETLIDELCKFNEAQHAHGAKIVGSTATISRAAEQVAALYGRRPEQSVLFPPQALSAGDSFFAEEKTGPENPGRQYVGVFAPALPSFVTTEVRVLSSLLQSPKLFEAEDKNLMDGFWTLVTYFNSIRELGHATTLVDQDIREYLAVLARRFGLLGGSANPMSVKRRWINNPLELTSRISNDEVTAAISQLFKPNSDRGAVDICLATNMIQVGIDVSRLGLMAVVGQPKTTAEYIQATSRVGRSKPGLVVSMLNPGKPRDRSHYEHFRAFHEAIYRNVEPTSVTPFSVPVRDRALHALIIGLARLKHGHLVSSVVPSAANQEAIEKTILDRVKIVDPDEVEHVRNAIRRYFEGWDINGPVRFGAPDARHNDVFPMMYVAGSDPSPDWTDFARPTGTSMRSVDAECEIYMSPLESYRET